ncbi:hypothetical protein QTP70_013375 [Hemibagrus guttatus]|uniref:Chromo domain-containing protein n=1 Tax=Hemibagrus guttatus TaxID=175788 RepID=A0AAE0RB15_9TELE|nr:hypothetical protein QTP70_013375 [Hemibagrus guttatus]
MLILESFPQTQCQKNQNPYSLQTCLCFRSPGRWMILLPLKRNLLRRDVQMVKQVCQHPYVFPFWTQYILLRDLATQAGSKPSHSSTKDPEVPPQPKVDTDDTIYQVREVVNSRRRGSRLQYLVDLKGYGPEERSWVDRDDNPSLLVGFHQRHPDRPAPRGCGHPSRLPRHMDTRYNVVHVYDRQTLDYIRLQGTTRLAFVTVRCRPFYLPWEFTTVFIVGVYIPPSSNAKEALCELYGAISELQKAHPDGLFIITGDFNHANLKSVLPKFHQHVDCVTRGVNALDLVYTNIPGVYRAQPRPHIGYSDHISVMLIPAYRPLVRRSKPFLKLVTTWPEGAISALQDCFECMFREAATNGDTTDLEEYTSSVTSYISKCIDDVTISKSITTRSNQKPWMTEKCVRC